jgi:hypothetical protein
VGDYLGDMDRREGNALELAMKRLQQRTTERGMADEDTARRIFSQYGDKARNPLMEAGLAKHAFALDDRGLATRKSEADIAKTGADTRKAEQEARNKQLEEAEKRISLSGSVFRGVMQNPTVDMAAQAVEFLRVNGVFPDEQAKGMLEELMQNPTPQNVAALAERAFRASISSKEQLEAFKQQGRGGTAAVIGVDPVTGQTRDVQSAPITQSADNAATNAKPPTSVQEFLYGQQNPAFNAWDKSRKKAGATNVNVEGSKNIMTQESEQSKAFGKGMGDLRIEIQKAGFAAPAQLNKLDRMDELLSGVEGGKYAPLGLEIANAARSLGINIDPKLGNKQASEALAVEMALAMRPPGSGPMTDKDFDNLMLTVPGLSKTAEGRKQISQTMRAKAKRDIEIAKKARAYAAKNNGVLDDAFLDEVAQFVADNPVVPDAVRPAGANPEADALVNKYRSKK